MKAATVLLLCGRRFSEAPCAFAKNASKVGYTIQSCMSMQSAKAVNRRLLNTIGLMTLVPVLSPSCMMSSSGVKYKQNTIAVKLEPTRMTFIIANLLLVH